MSLFQRLRDDYADFCYKWDKCRLENKLITASIRGEDKKAARLVKKLSKLRYKRMDYLFGRIARKRNLRLVK